MFGLMIKANELERKGQKIIHFEIGDPNFDSPRETTTAAIQALNEGFTHYTDSMGIMELRETIAEITEKEYGFRPDLNQILITPANAAIDFVIRCVANPGDEIILPDPGFPTYLAAATYSGMKPIGIPLREENKFRMNPEDVNASITKKTRLIIINSPNNPTGSIMTKNEVMEIASIAEDNDIFLLSDEVYSKIIYSGKHISPSIVDACKDRTIVLGSMSKIYAMSGWRIGYIIGPEKLIAKMMLLLQTTISCLPAFTQIGAIAAFKECDMWFKDYMNALEERRNVLTEGLNSLRGVSCVTPEGALYAFPNINNTGMTSIEFSNKMLEAGVCVLPGDYFGNYGNSHVRLCFGSTSVDTIKNALLKMEKVLKESIV